MEGWRDGGKARKGRDEPWEEGGPTSQVRGELYGVKSVDGTPHQCGLDTRATQPVLSTPRSGIGRELCKPTPVINSTDAGHLRSNSLWRG